MGRFGGFFLHAGNYELLPRNQLGRPRLSTLIAATTIIRGFIYSVVRLTEL